MKLALLILSNIILAAGYSQELAYTANKYSGINIDALLAGNTFLQAAGKITGPPHYAIARSTLGIGGSSKTFTNSNGTYYISQSIGQASVIGTSSKKGYTAMQGFQQPFLSVKILQPPELHMLKATIYPNPFSHSINVLFDGEITNDIFIVLLDVRGRAVITKKVSPARRIELLLNNISNGIYILKLTTGDKTFTAQLLKE